MALIEYYRRCNFSIWSCIFSPNGSMASGGHRQELQPIEDEGLARQNTDPY